MSTLTEALLGALHLPVTLDVDLSDVAAKDLVALSYRFPGDAQVIAAALCRIGQSDPERCWMYEKLAEICRARGAQAERDDATRLAASPHIWGADDFPPPAKRPTSIIEALTSVVKLPGISLELALDQPNWDRVCYLYPETAEAVCRMLVKLAQDEPDPRRRASYEERADRCVIFGMLGIFDRSDDDEDEEPIPLTHDLWVQINDHG